MLILQQKSATNEVVQVLHPNTAVIPMKEAVNGLIMQQ